MSTEGFAQQPNAYSASIALRTVRDRRNTALIALRKSSEDLIALTDADPTMFSASITKLQTMSDDLKVNYDHLLVALHRGDPLDGETITEPLRQLRDGEHKIGQQTNDLANLLGTAS